uniref:Putative EEIG1/EHBP1 N-terminal domain-containing protein n=2 Tax=Helianthus annuus TaxID=4232 RepID=A0A251SE67_HELAN
MFKSGRWKGQNNKIKIMFQLQFQATQVPKMKGKGLMIALLQEDTAKPAAKLKKVPIVDGTCTWEEPVYEMVKLVKDQKTETYKERIYYFNVQTGSSKSGFVGEVGVDFANFVGITEPVQLSLPLTTSNNGAILHVYIQKMQRTDELRTFGENESLSSESFRSKNQASDSIENGNSNPVNKQRSSTDWSFGSLSDRSMGDTLKSPQHSYTEASKDDVHALKSEVSRLEKQAELSALELESLRKQILKENKRSQDLSTKMSELNEENEALETECDEIKEELKYEKSLNKDLVRKMEGKNIEISHLAENIDALYARLELERKEKEELKIHIEDNELQIKRLEEKIMNQALEISKSLDKNEEFETHIIRLEKELEKQAHEFENDVQDLMKLKIEQEERVVQAEEALKKSTLTNAAEVEKLCDQINQQMEQIKQISLEIEAYKEHGEHNYDLKELNSLKKESTSWKSSISEKNVMIRTLKLELKMLRGDYSGLKEKLSEIESEKDNLQKEVSKLEKKHLNLVKEKESKVACDVTTGKHDERRSILELEKSNEGRCSEEKPLTHIFSHNDEQKLNNLLHEISSMDERNRHMESELKEMQEKYSEVSLRFAEVESERQQLVMALRNLQNSKKK